MARTARILFESSSYHVITRGIRKEDVFLERADFERYLHILWKYKSKFRVKVYAYCLMPNHVHLLINPIKPGTLKHIMHRINLSYAQYYNFKYNKCGHLWQNRYKSFLVQNDEYLINIISYIEYNPIRANICKRAEDYSWCSYKFRVLDKKNNILDKFKI